MAYDEVLADRIRRVVGPREDVSEKKMFGGLAFMIDGKMFCGAMKDVMVVRLSPEGWDEALREPHTRPMDFTGKPMRGFLYVDREGWSTDKAVERWADRGMAFAATQEKKSPKKKAKAPAEKNKNKNKNKKKTTTKAPAKKTPAKKQPAKKTSAKKKR